MAQMMFYFNIHFIDFHIFVLFAEISNGFTLSALSSSSPGKPIFARLDRN